MSPNQPPAQPVRLTLFWRTFLLIALLLGLSLFGWYCFFVWFERAPRAQQFAEQLVSVVKLTRTALIYADPTERQNLLGELALNEGIRVLPLEPDDVIKALPDRKLLQMIGGFIQLELGTETRIVGQVNDQPGLWVSFSIEEDWYWVSFPADRVNRIPALEWLGWASIAIILSLIGALFIGRFVNRPLAQLTAAARLITHRRLPKNLPERGPAEIRLLTNTFNKMVQDLQKSEQDRTFMLAGISHDLRTPLTRLRLELEMSALDTTTRQGMASDLDQMEAIVKQFTDFARLQHHSENQQTIELAELIRQTVQPYQQRLEENTLTLNLDLATVGLMRGNPQEIQRLIVNLLENALRYAGQPTHGETKVISNSHVTIDIRLTQIQRELIVSIRDYGPGVPEQELPELTQPFKRLNSARTDTQGTGLGLAIVERIMQRHHGKLTIRNVLPHGLEFELRFPSLPPEPPTA